MFPIYMNKMPLDKHFLYLNFRFWGCLCSVFPAGGFFALSEDFSFAGAASASCSFLPSFYLPQFFPDWRLPRLSHSSPLCGLPLLLWGRLGQRGFFCLCQWGVWGIFLLLERLSHQSIHKPVFLRFFLHADVWLWLTLTVFIGSANRENFTA